MALGARSATLDVPERQVLIDYFDGPYGLVWHHRLLLLATSEAGVWVCATPDHDVVRLDLNLHRVIALGRASPFPEGLRGKIYPFDPITEGDLRFLRQHAGDIGTLLDAPAAWAAAVVPYAAWAVAVVP
jgi:hypothetical protein